MPVKVARCFHDHTGWFNNIRRNILMATRSQLINSIDILRARRATGLMTRDNYRTVNNITLGKYPEAK